MVEYKQPSSQSPLVNLRLSSNKLNMKNLLALSILAIAIFFSCPAAYSQEKESEKGKIKHKDYSVINRSIYYPLSIK